MSIPTLLLVGAKHVLPRLTAQFPPDLCRIMPASSMVQSLALARNATLVVAEAKLAAGVLQGWRQLRTELAARRVPVILLKEAGAALPAALEAEGKVAAVVDVNELNVLVQTLRKLVPELGAAASPPSAAAPSSAAHSPAAPSAAAPSSAAHSSAAHSPAAPPPAVPEPEFAESVLDEEELEEDHGQATHVWRREEAEAGGWPLPPEHQTGQDVLQYAGSFSKHLRVLSEALAKPERHPQESLRGLAAAVHHTVPAAEQCLGLLQSAMNDALMAKNLEQMKVLGSAKNNLYDQLKHFRSLVEQFDQLLQDAAPGPAPTIATPPLPPAAGKASPTLSAHSAVSAEAVKKSALTLAAEAKARAKHTQAEVAKVKPARPERARPLGSSARIDAIPSMSWGTWLAIGVAALAVIGAGTYFASRFTGETAAQPSASRANTPPQLVMAKLDETPAGIFVQLKADDKENDRVSYKIQWFINGELVQGPNSARLEPKAYSAGDRICVVVEPSDAYAAGRPQRSEELVAKGAANAGAAAASVQPPSGASGTETPGSEEPATEEPATETPGSEEPATEAPGSEAPGSEAPGSEAPSP